MSMDESGWESFSRGSPVRRAGRAGFLRNVAVALGNWGSAEAVRVLVAALRDGEALVRGHVAWALGEIGSPAALDALGTAVQSESDPWVAAEIARASERKPG
jgi:epoxyqueuosine reductase